MVKERLGERPRKRGGAPGGMSIEATGKLWARRKACEMRAGLEKSVLIIRTTDEYDRLLALAPLTGEEEMVGWGVRVDEVGSIYTPSWRTKMTQPDEEGRRILVNPEGWEYRVMNRRRIRHDFFENLPKGIHVNELIMHGVDSDIETAIRQQRHILENYQPGQEAGEVQLAREVVEHTDWLANKYITEEKSVTTKDLELLGRRTGEFLEKIDLVDPRDPEKKKMLDMLLKVNLKDSLGRHNPLVARVRARAAYLAAAKRIVVGGMVTRKFASNEQVLLYERETTRWVLEMTRSQLGQVLGHADFKRADGKATESQRSAIANILMNISEGHLVLPRVKTYLESARYAAINLVGCREFKKEENRKILGESVASDLFSRTPTRILVMDGKFSEARERIYESREVIGGVLGNDKYKSI